MPAPSSTTPSSSAEDSLILAILTKSGSWTCRLTSGNLYPLSRIKGIPHSLLENLHFLDFYEDIYSILLFYIACHMYPYILRHVMHISLAQPYSNCFQFIYLCIFCVNILTIFYMLESIFSNEFTLYCTYILRDIM